MDQKPHICVLTSAHPLDDVRVYTKVVKSFLDNGWKVSWVGPDISTHDESELDPRVSYHLTPTIRGRMDRLRSPRRLPAAAKSLRDVDWWYSPDPDAARVGVRLAKRQGGRSVFDIHEIFHKYHLQKWTLGRDVKWLSSSVRARIRSTCMHSDLVIAVGQTVLDTYTSGINTTAILVRNCAPKDFADQGGFGDPDATIGHATRIMHGKAALSNGTPAVLEALRIYDRPDSPVEVLMFDEPRTSQFDQAQFDVGNPLVEVTTLRPVPHHEVPKLTASCDLGLIANDRSLGIVCLPNRLFEYMAAGTAVLAPSYSPEIKAVLESEGIGLTVDFELPSEIARGLEWFADNPEETKAMGTRAQKAFLERHNWELEFDKLLSHLGDHIHGR